MPTPGHQGVKSAHPTVKIFPHITIMNPLMGVHTADGDKIQYGAQPQRSYENVSGTPKNRLGFGLFSLADIANE